MFDGKTQKLHPLAVGTVKTVKVINIYVSTTYGKYGRSPEATFFLLQMKRLNVCFCRINIQCAVKVSQFQLYSTALRFCTKQRCACRLLFFDKRYIILVTVGSFVGIARVKFQYINCRRLNGNSKKRNAGRRKSIVRKT